ncbi:MAG TPA: hypothetical protein VGL71_09330 [Urbifossiella sp.]|jgi:hypothetical protein
MSVANRSFRSRLVTTTFWSIAASRLGDYHRDIGTEVASSLGVFAEQKGIEVVPAFGARGIASGGTTPAADSARIASEFLSDLRGPGRLMPPTSPFTERWWPRAIST